MRSGTVNSSLTRGYGTLGGLGIIGAALFAVPSTLLLEPRPQADAYLATLAGLATGFICLALPWERMDTRWLHLVGILATVEAAWAVAVFGQAYVAFYFLIAVSVAYMAPNARSLAPHLVFIGVAILAPIVYGPEDARSTLQLTLVVYPLLALTASLIAYLRQRLVADHRSYRLFAEETLALADRIAGYSLTAQQPARVDERGDLPDWSRYRVSARASAAAAAILALPLLTAGLAAAGVKLPAFAADTFGNVGIDLPNQSAAHDAPEAVTIERQARARSTRSHSDGPTADKGAAGGDTKGGHMAADAGDEGNEGDAATSEPVSGAAVSADDSPSASGSAVPPPDDSPIQGTGEDAGQSGSLGQVLEETTDGLNGLLGGLSQGGE
jgi:hypothetical protein